MVASGALWQFSERGRPEGDIQRMGASNSDAIRQTSEAQTPGPEGSTPSCSTKQPELLEKAISDRDARPWNYYRLDHDVMKRLLNEQAEELQRLRLALHGISDMLLQTL